MIVKARVVLLYKVLKIRKKYIFIFVVFLLVISVLINNSTILLKFIYPVKYEKYVFEYAKMYGVDPYLVFAIIKAESGFNPDAVSHRNAKGLMQITDGTGRWAVEKIGLKGDHNKIVYDPEKNIQIGCWYLRWLIDNLDDIELVIAAYNGGIGNIKEWLKNSDLSSSGLTLDKIPFKETEKYLKKVKNYYYVYLKLYK